MSAKTEALLRNPTFRVALTSEDSLRTVAQRFGVSFGFVQNARATLDALPPTEHENETTEEDSEGRKTVTAIRDRPVTMDDARDWLKVSGDEPDDYTISIRAIAYGDTMFSNRMSATPKLGREKAEPKWPVIQAAAPVIVEAGPQIVTAVRVSEYDIGLKFADNQIGYRILADGTLEAFHDEAAMAVAVQACRYFAPEKITILGDFLDLASQSRWAQEAAFARTTQPSLDRGHRWLAELRAAAPNAEIVIVEGNHDKRMQNFVEANALAAFGLKRANLPESWPVMSIPYLLRLDELDIRYVDAYPAATDWDNDLTRNIHGTKANSKGSTMSQYVHDLPHVNTWAGHTHRTEIVYRSVLGARGEAIESYAANPGCLCRTDGAVPSVNGAIGADGTSARVVEDWQAGFGVLYYNERESIPQVYRIRNGRALVDGFVLDGTRGLAA